MIKFDICIWIIIFRALKNWNFCFGQKTFFNLIQKINKTRNFLKIAFLPSSSVLVLMRKIKTFFQLNLTSYMNVNETPKDLLKTTLSLSISKVNIIKSFPLKFSTFSLSLAYAVDVKQLFVFKNLIKHLRKMFYNF